VLSRAFLARSGALRAFEEQVAAVQGDLPLRLIGTSTGALLCALYAERNPQAVESLFLMSPVRLTGVCVLAAER
jgi:alpha-beta hydrolase superfamily lysophospholipase